MKITILGGSSPFTASLIDAMLPRLAQMPPLELVFHGRNTHFLTLMTHYAETRLGVPARWETDTRKALQDADVVVHQIRYGGLDLRDAGEQLCARLNLPADETLGPAALLTALRIREDLEPTLDALETTCPNAWVLNLTNPLSSVTALMAERLPRVMGLCELPLFTLMEAARLLELPVADLSWSYHGYNHRGFLHHLSHGDHNLMPRLIEALTHTPIGGIEARVATQLQALPLKYFSLFTRPQTAGPGRARFLQDLRRRIAQELETQPQRSPRALRERYLEWYPLSVAPVLEALTREEPTTHVVNLPQGNGLVGEMTARINRHGITVTPQATPPAKVAQWLRRFEAHEQAFLSAVRKPTPDRVHQALSVDPLIPDGRAEQAAHGVWQSYRTSMLQEITS